MSDHERVKQINELSRLSYQAINHQLILVNYSIGEVTSNKWVLGYIFGLVGALAHAHDFGPPGAIALLANTCDHLTGGYRGDMVRAFSLSEVIVNEENDSIFQEGAVVGQQELVQFLLDNNHLPSGMIFHLPTRA